MPGATAIGSTADGTTGVTGGGGGGGGGGTAGGSTATGVLDAIAASTAGSPSCANQCTNPGYADGFIATNTRSSGRRWAISASTSGAEFGSSAVRESAAPTASDPMCSHTSTSAPSPVAPGKTVAARTHEHQWRNCDARVNRKLGLPRHWHGPPGPRGPVPRPPSPRRPGTGGTEPPPGPLLLGSTRPLGAYAALAGVRAQLTEAVDRVEPGDACRLGRAPVSQEPPRLFLTISSHPSSLSSDEDILHQMKSVRRRAGQEHFRGRAGSGSRGGSRGKCRTCQGSDLRRWVTPSAMFRLTAVAHQLELRPEGPMAVDPAPRLRPLRTIRRRSGGSPLLAR